MSMAEMSTRRAARTSELSSLNYFRNCKRIHTEYILEKSEITIIQLLIIFP